MKHRINPLAFRQVWEADKGQGSGAGSDEGNDNNQGAGAGQGADPDQYRRIIDNLISRHGDADAVATMLYRENYQHREQIRQLQEQIPPEGAVVLTDPADLEAWNGRGDLAAQLEQAQQQIAGFERKRTVREAAEAAGYNAKVLGGLFDQIGEPAALETTTKDGATVATIRIGEEADPIPLADYAAEHWADYLPALKPDTRPAGTPYPGQAGSNGQAPGGDTVAARKLAEMKARAEAPNPLRPAKKER